MTFQSLSYGQSSIESGFSISKEHLVEHHQRESITLPTVNNHLLANNLTQIIQIKKELMTNANFSRQHYMAAFEE